MVKNADWYQLGHLLFFLRFYLFIFRERGKEGEREISMCGCLSHAPYWGPGLQPRHVPWLGIKPVNLWFAGWCSIHWATPARAATYSWESYRFSFRFLVHNGDNIYFMHLLWHINNLIQLRNLEQWFTHSKCHISVSYCEYNHCYMNGKYFI